ncbi:uncharacterized protein LOC128552150 [Mercenaria mercenaria]|uniref:uncharacterized protein LOC128552150 n=1 Tax=Mercenaria mercenaria TaxID=6596 RepID=UPI00234F4CE0|nr:uncharacterized protein LOC128552150 [Mercenaria mercenaria]
MRYSDLTKLQRTFVWLQRFKTYCRHRYLKHDVQVPTDDITVIEVRNATRDILKCAQKGHFSEELSALRMDNPVKKDSRIASLNPILHDGLIRVHGRVRRGNLQEYPLILPSKHHVTTLIVRHYHNINNHVGTQQVLAATREKYWIIHGSSSVKKTIGNCFICRRQHSPLLTQQIAPLVSEQTTPDKPPFTYIGVDNFGPLLVKSGRSHSKRYGCLFTCLATRAVHIEIAYSLTTDSFIAAFQRFTSRRGTPEKVFSDNGSNLVSIDRELK